MHTNREGGLLHPGSWRPGPPKALSPGPLLLPSSPSLSAFQPRDTCTYRGSSGSQEGRSTPCLNLDRQDGALAEWGV